MVKQAEFLFDFGSPNAWCAHKVIPAIEQRTSAKFTYTPILLGGLFKLTGNQAPMLAFAGIPNKVAYEQLELRRYIARHKLPFAFNPNFPVNTLLIMRMATAADMDGALAPYADAVFRFMWETPRKMDDPAIVAAALTEAGLNAETPRRPRARSRRQSQAFVQHRSRRQTRRLRLPHLLRQRRDVLW